MSSIETKVATVPEFAEILKVHPRTVERMIQRGDLKIIRVGRLIRIPLTELQRCTR